MSAVEVAAVAYLLWGGRAYQIVPTPTPGVPTDLYAIFKQAWIDACNEAERQPDLLSIEEDVNGSKLYDLTKVLCQDGKTHKFYARDLIVRCNLDLTAEINFDANSRFSVEGGIPYTNSALREIRQIRVTTTAITRVKLQFAGRDLGLVSP